MHELHFPLTNRGSILTVENNFKWKESAMKTIHLIRVLSHLYIGV
jgi:hypothetical protein